MFCLTESHNNAVHRRTASSLLKWLIYFAVPDDGKRSSDLPITLSRNFQHAIFFMLAAAIAAKTMHETDSQSPIPVNQPINHDAPR